MSYRASLGLIQGLAVAFLLLGDEACHICRSPSIDLEDPSRRISAPSPRP